MKNEELCGIIETDKGPFYWVADIDSGEISGHIKGYEGDASGWWRTTNPETAAHACLATIIRNEAIES